MSNRAIYFMLMLLFSVLVTSCASSNVAMASVALGRMRSEDYFKLLLDRRLADAIGHDNLGAINARIAEGADVNAHGRDDMTPLFWAIGKGSKGAFELLLKRGANPNLEIIRTTSSGAVQQLSVMKIAAMMDDPFYLQMALRYGGNPNAISYDHRTIMFEAIIHHRTNNVKLLANSGANIVHQDSAGITPLLLAANIKSYDVVFELLQRGADPRIKNRFGYDLARTINTFGMKGRRMSYSERAGFDAVVRTLRAQGLL